MLGSTELFVVCKVLLLRGVRDFPLGTLLPVTVHETFAWLPAEGVTGAVEVVPSALDLLGVLVLGYADSPVAQPGKPPARRLSPHIKADLVLVVGV